MMLKSTGLPDTPWAKGIHHRNWLCSGVPSRSIENGIKILKWPPKVNIIYFSSFQTFGKPIFAFLYLPSNPANKKLLAMTIHVCFESMESDERLCLAYEPIAKLIYVVPFVIFKTCSKDQLPPISMLLNGLSRQDEGEHRTSTASHDEKGLHQPFLVFFSHLHRNRKSQGP